MRTYLDNAATSWPKPDPVYAAMDRYQREVGAAAGRGAYHDAVEAQRVVDAARRQIADLLGVGDSRRIVFATNGTDALNMAIHGLLKPGDHVVSTVCEHNSVLRPLAAASRSLEVETTFVGCGEEGVVDPAEIARAIRPTTRLVAVTHASNVTGAIQPVAEIAAAAHAAGALVLVDAAQSVGHLPIDVHELKVDLLAASGHKGLLGPLGTGVLYIRPGLEAELSPLRQGGTGLNSQSDRQPDEMPYRFEAGNLNVPALAGLAAAAEYLSERTVASLAEHEARLILKLLDGLAVIEGIRLYGPPRSKARAPVVSLSAQDYDPQEFATALDSSFGVQCRAGLHCAPKMHEALGTLQRGGLVRLSLGWSTAEADVDRALEALAALAPSA